MGCCCGREYGMRQQIYGIRSKQIERYGNSMYRVGVASMNGCREEMEDRHTVRLALEGHPDISYFGVFDGHCGVHAANYMRSTLHERIAALPNPTGNLLELQKVFEHIDQDFLQTTRGSGCTACVVLMEPGTTQNKVRLTVCNVGDSRCIVIDKMRRVQFTTVDHRPTDPVERVRIEAAGGHVTNARVDGELALSRAIGDRRYKCNDEKLPSEQKVIARPTITQLDVSVVDCSSVLICCDGLLERLTGAELARVVNNRELCNLTIAANCKSDPLQRLMYALDVSLVNGSHDNMSGILIDFGYGGTYPDTNTYLPAICDSQELKDPVFMTSFLADAEDHGLTEVQTRSLITASAAEKLAEDNGIGVFLLGLPSGSISSDSDDEYQEE
jgi:protein phosphatase